MKNSSKRIILKHSPVAITLELVGVALLLSILYVTVTLYPDLQGTVPRSFSASGVISTWGSKQVALLWPMATVYVYLILTAISLLIRRIPDEEGHNVKISMALMMILCAKIVFLIFALASTYATMSINDMPSWSILILPVGICITVFVGIRIVRDRDKGSYSLVIKEAKV